MWYYQKGYDGEPVRKTGNLDLDNAYKRGQVHRRASDRKKNSLNEKVDLFTNNPLSIVDVAAAHGVASLGRILLWAVSLPVKLGAWSLSMLLRLLGLIFIVFPKFLWSKGKAGRIVLTSIVGVLLLAIAAPQIYTGFFKEPPLEPVYAYVNQSALNLRSQPSAESGMLGVIPVGEKVIVAEEIDGSSWVKVVFGDLEGYVNSDYLSASAE
jgi:hypothetical protein